MTGIGFIGLGNMGLPMATNLVKAGHGVTGFDTNARAMEAAAASGVVAAKSAGEAVDNADIVITMLPNGEIVRSVFDEIIPACQKDAVIVDSSTIDVTSAKTVHEMARAEGLLCLDAPVSGGVAGAQAGTLTFMIGGSVDALKKARPALEVMGGRLIHCGEGGSGQAIKICNQMLLAISMIGACEVFELAKQLGLSQQALFDVLSTSSGSCWAVTNYCPVPGIGPETPADHDYKPGFAASLMLKDLRLSQQAAESAGQPTPLGGHATQIYEAFVGSGNGGLDYSAVIRAFDGPANDR